MATATDSLEFPDVFVLKKGTLVRRTPLEGFPQNDDSVFQNPGRLRLQKDKVVFKLNKTGKVEQIGAGDIRSCHWMKVAKGYELKIMLSAGLVHKFAGFREMVSFF